MKRSKRWTDRDIARVFGVPPEALQELRERSRGTASNASIARWLLGRLQQEARAVEARINGTRRQETRH